MLRCAVFSVSIVLCIYSTEAAPSENTDFVGCRCLPYYECVGNSNTITNGEVPIDYRSAITAPQECPGYNVSCCFKSPDETKPAAIPQQPYHSPSGWGRCGASDPVRYRVAGNDNSGYGEFPWMVQLLQKGAPNPRPFRCGGSLIHPQVVLTAAHCVKRNQNLYVRAGEWDKTAKEELFPTQDRDVRTVIIHDGFYEGNLRNDIALLVLESPFKPSPTVGTICLDGAPLDTKHCVVTGWGKDTLEPEGKYQTILKKMELPIVPRETCESILRRTSLTEEFNLHDSFLCAGAKSGGNACKGDGGGPLVCRRMDDSDTYVQAGIVSWGISCGSNIPVLYADVAYFRSWINDNMDSLIANRRIQDVYRVLN